jgi:hypothetical protein
MGQRAGRRSVSPVAGGIWDFHRQNNIEVRSPHRVGQDVALGGALRENLLMLHFSHGFGMG